MIVGLPFCASSCNRRLLLQILLVGVAVVVASFQIPKTTTTTTPSRSRAMMGGGGVSDQRRRSASFLKMKQEHYNFYNPNNEDDNDDEDDDDDDYITLETDLLLKDWRQVRAKLVRQEQLEHQQERLKSSSNSNQPQQHHEEHSQHQEHYDEERQQPPEDQQQPPNRPNLVSFHSFRDMHPFASKPTSKVTPAPLSFAGPPSSLSKPSSSSSSNTNTGNNNPMIDSSWLYDAGLHVEKGCLLVSQIEETLGGHDLVQPYFHKSIVLIVEHYEDDYEDVIVSNHHQNGYKDNNDDEEKDYTTRGIILNRPSNLILENEDILEILQKKHPCGRSDYKWQVSFGGDVAALHDPDNTPPLLLFVHSVHTELAHQVSKVIVPAGDDGSTPPILVTTHKGACRLLEAGDAKSCDDFRVFGGICNWEPQQLQNEIEAGLWHLLSADSSTVWDEITSSTTTTTKAKQHKQERQLFTYFGPQQQEETPVADIQNAGMPSWRLLLQKAGKPTSNSDEYFDHDDEDSFSDCMLKEWIHKNLDYNINEEIFDGDDDNNEDFNASKDYTGTILRASASPSSSSFLLQDQYLHQSTVLVYQDDNPLYSVGLMLNMPTTESITLVTPKRTINFPIRYGGPNTMVLENKSNNDQSDTMVWLHTSAVLGTQCGIGKPIGDNFWSCSAKDVAQAIDAGLALPREFIVIRGFTAWEKQQQQQEEDGSTVGGIQGQIAANNFQPVEPQQFVEYIWPLLVSQEPLSEQTLSQNLQLAQNAWHLACLQPQCNHNVGERSAHTSLARNTDVKKGERTTVFGSDVPLTQLQDEALRIWINIFLLENKECQSSF